MVLVGTDSHTTTHGAFGAFATGIGATEMAGVWTEGTLWFKVPATLRIEVEGEFRPWISAKDLILYIIGRLGAAGADYRAVEFDGAGHPADDGGVAHGAGQPLDGDGRQGGVHAGGRDAAGLAAPTRPRSGWRRSGRTRTRATSGSCASTPARTCRSRRSPARTPWTMCSRSRRWAKSRCSRRSWDRAPTGGWKTWRSRRASSQGAQVHPRTRLRGDPGVAADLPRGHAAGLPGDAGGGRRDDRIRRAAVRVWECTRGFWRRARLASRPPTATSSAGWAAKTRWCTWPARRWWRRPPWRASWSIRDRS